MPRLPSGGDPEAESRGTHQRLDRSALQAVGLSRAYPARCLRVIDGDTFVARIDLGFRVTTEQSLRLIGIDTPELRSPSHQIRLQAIEARDWVEAWMAEHQAALSWPLLVLTTKGDSFGRWLADVRSVLTDESLNERLVREGFATPYP